jgi:hypothetical protein
MDFRYLKTEKWLKGNTHIHSTKSDGGQDFAQLARMYASKGYDFLFRTDHWVASDVKAESESYPLLWLDGVELDGFLKDTGSTFHIVCLGSFKELTRELGLERAFLKAKEQGAITILAHPGWCGNLEKDLFRFDCDGVEIYNHDCLWGNGKADGITYWNMMLTKNTQYLGFAVDDAHIRPNQPLWNGGWIMVQSEELSSEAITRAIKKGLFFSSCAPLFKKLEYADNTIYAETSGVQYARLVGYGWYGSSHRAEDNKPIYKFEFKLPENYKDWRYLYLEIEDFNGKKAWSNTLFIN